MLNNKTTTILKNTRAFSLGEIMIVLVIIGGIMAIILPKIRDGQIRAQVNQSKLKMSEITTKLNEYYSECGKYPSSLSFIVEDSSDCKNWASNPKLNHLLKDGFGTEFDYAPAGNGYNLSSKGADKKDGGSSYDKDIISDESVGSEE